MDTKKAIEVLKTEIKFFKIENENCEPNDDIDTQIISANKILTTDYNQIIELLQRGEKFEKIVKEIKYELEWHKPEEPLFIALLEVSKDKEFLNEILDLIADIEQKYFPQPSKNFTEKVMDKINKGDYNE